MSKAAFWQRGEALDYTNTGTKTIEANTIISFGGHIGIAGTDIFTRRSWLASCYGRF